MNTSSQEEFPWISSAGYPIFMLPPHRRYGGGESKSP
jgi:hypothetical protein